MNKICRICLEDSNSMLSSIFTKNFSISLSDMIEYCCNVKIEKDDGLPEFICGNCIYKLGISYHLKQTFESADIRLRQYLSLPLKNKSNDVSVMTDPIAMNVTIIKKCVCVKDKKRTSNYKPKPESEKQKRGPKPKEKPPLSCFTCGKEFRCQAQLDMHVRTHTGQKPFSCPFCQRSFAQKHNLTIHQRLHSGDRPYQCEICSKRFTAQGNLLTHIKVHNGQKDHECTICQKSFVTSSELTRHTNNHKGARNYKCEICDISFVQLRDLKLHKLKKHQIEIEPSKPPKKEIINRNDIDIIGLDVGKDLPELDLKPVLSQTTLNTDKTQPDSAMYESKSLKESSMYPYACLEKHVCTFCGEQFDYVTELAQHCLNSHKSYDPNPMRNFNLSFCKYIESSSNE